jgi:hypothetical protein
MADDKSRLQYIWAWALILMGLAVFVRIPQVMPKIEQIPVLAGNIVFVKFSLYFLGVLLVWGGAQKLYLNFRKSRDGD